MFGIKWRVMQDMQTRKFTWLRGNKSFATDTEIRDKLKKGISRNLLHFIIL